MTTDEIQVDAAVDVEVAAQFVLDAAARLKKHKPLAMKVQRLPVDDPVRVGVMTDYHAALAEAAVAGTYLSQRYETWRAADGRPIDLQAEVKKARP